jgi:putative flippase GtrA
LYDVPSIEKSPQERRIHLNVKDGVRAFVIVYARSVLRYAMIAGGSAGVEWSVFFFCFRFVGSAVLSACVAFLLATLFNYCASRRVGFIPKRPLFEEMWLTYVFSALAFVVNLGMFMLLYASLSFPVMIAKVVGTGTGFLMNFAFRQFLIFDIKPK